MTSCIGLQVPLFGRPSRTRRTAARAVRVRERERADHVGVWSGKREVGVARARAAEQGDQRKPASGRRRMAPPPARTRNVGMREGGLEPPSLSAPDPKSGASASSATLAFRREPNAGPQPIKARDVRSDEPLEREANREPRGELRTVEAHPFGAPRRSQEPAWPQRRFRRESVASRRASSCSRR